MAETPRKTLSDFAREVGVPLPSAAQLVALGATPGTTKAGALTHASGPVCVTGASGFIALHLVILLLDKGYQVVAAVRSIGKSPELTALVEKYPGRLNIVEDCDLLKSGSFDRAIAGCSLLIYL